MAQEGERLVGRVIPKVSCAYCDAEIDLPETARAGDTIEHCGRRQRLTYEFGSFAAESEAPKSQ